MRQLCSCIASHASPESTARPAHGEHEIRRPDSQPRLETQPDARVHDHMAWGNFAMATGMGLSTADALAQIEICETRDPVNTRRLNGDHAGPVSRAWVLTAS